MRFLPGSINIQGNNSFSTWARLDLKLSGAIYSLWQYKSQMEGFNRKLMRIGLDNIYGFVVRIFLLIWAWTLPKS